MARRKRVHPMLRIARIYAATERPDLTRASMRVRQIDGPPGGPRYAVILEGCLAQTCPFGVARQTRDAGQCSFRCAHRDTCRLLLSRDGQIISVTNSHEHYT